MGSGNNWVSAKLTLLTSVALALSQKPYFLIDGFRFVEFRQFWVHFVKKKQFLKVRFIFTYWFDLQCSVQKHYP